MLRNHRAEVKLTASEDVTLPDGLVCSPVWAHRQETIRPKGDFETLYLAWAVETILLVMACTGLRGRWTWDAVGERARRQTARLETTPRPGAGAG